MSETTTTSSGGEVRSVKRAQVGVEDGFNPRRELGEVDDLAASVAQHGILQPLLVRPGDDDGSFVLVDGHRRLAAAAQAGLDRIPVLVRDDLDGQALVAALVTALKRENLDPVEEAQAYGRLVDGGLTRKGVAEAVGVAQRTVTTRLQILQVPESLNAAIATGEIALSSVPALVAMAKISPPLAELVGRHSPDRIDAFAAERLVASGQGKDGLWPANAIDIDQLELGEEQRKQAAALSDQWSVWRPRFGKDELDRARAAGVLHSADDDGYGYRSAVICDTELVRDLTVAVLARDTEQRARRLADERKAAGMPPAGSPEANKLKAERQAQRQAERELAVRARGANLDLGRKLLERLAELDWSKDLAELMAYSILSQPVPGYWSEQAAGGAYSVAQLAGRGLRYVLADWQDEQPLKNGTTKVTYAGAAAQQDGREELEQRFWDWFETAKTAEQIAGRLVIALAPPAGRSTNACRAPAASTARSTRARTSGRSRRSSASPARPSRPR